MEVFGLRTVRVCVCVGWFFFFFLRVFVYGVIEAEAHAAFAHCRGTKHINLFGDGCE